MYYVEKSVCVCVYPPGRLAVSLRVAGKSNPRGTVNGRWFLSEIQTHRQRWMFPEGTAGKLALPPTSLKNTPSFCVCVCELSVCCQDVFALANWCYDTLSMPQGYLYGGYVFLD